ncbi:hypothetical protein ACIBG0_41780 [Nocardia sp. NPDC050630]|uniref:hypothetical protein n=1 Tax=Nocardia sp. NPDC050630 TaxID=3364321 RepID=UPI0037A9DD4F
MTHISALQALQAHGTVALASAAGHVITGIRLPVYLPATDTAATPSTPPYVTVVGVCDRTQVASKFVAVPDWCRTVPTPDAPPVVAVLSPVRHITNTGTAIQRRVHLAAVTIDDSQRVGFVNVEFTKRLVAAINRRWDQHMSAILGYPAPTAVQLWNHPR